MMLESMKKKILFMLLLLAGFTASAQQQPVENYWRPNPHLFPDNMTIIAVIQINGVEQLTDALELGAFCGDVCRGSQMLNYYNGVDRYLAFLTVYGENNDAITFKLYDHNQEIEIGTSSQSTTFSTNAIVGDPRNPYEIKFQTGLICSFLGQTNSNWSLQDNWQDGIMPGETDEVAIEANCILDTDAQVEKISIAEGKSLTIVNGKALCVEDLVTTSVTQLVIENGGQLINTSENVLATVKKDIKAYGEEEINGWYTLSIPTQTISINESAGDFLAQSYDLYLYDETNLDQEEWRNYKNDEFATFIPGKGYLYANSNTLSLAAQGVLNFAPVQVSLTYTDRPNDELEGFNLIGNPFPHYIAKGADGAIDEARLSSGYYVMDHNGEWQLKTDADPIAPFQGILVKTSEACTLTVNKIVAKPSNQNREERAGSLAVSVEAGSFQDMAYIIFGGGTGLDKVSYHNALAPMVFVRQNGKDYAIAHECAKQGEIILCLKVAASDSCRLSLEGDKDFFRELVLVDKQDGKEFDLLNDTGEDIMSYHLTSSSDDNQERFVIRYKMK